MATTITSLNNQQFSFSGLDTYNYTMKTSGTKMINVRVTGSANTTSASNVSNTTVLIKVNGSTKVTATGSTGANGISAGLTYNFTATDILAIVVSSTAAEDAGPNRVHGAIFLNDSTGGNG